MSNDETVGKIETEELESIVDRIERINEEISERTEDRKDIFSEAKSRGFDIKALRTLVSIRKQDQNDVEAQDAILSVYKMAMGMK